MLRLHPELALQLRRRTQTSHECLSSLFGTFLLESHGRSVGASSRWFGLQLLVDLLLLGLVLGSSFPHCLPGAASEIVFGDVLMDSHNSFKYIAWPQNNPDLLMRIMLPMIPIGVSLVVLSWL